MRGRYRKPSIFWSVIGAAVLLFTVQGHTAVDPETAVGVWLFNEAAGDVAKDLIHRLTSLCRDTAISCAFAETLTRITKGNRCSGSDWRRVQAFTFLWKLKLYRNGKLVEKDISAHQKENEDNHKPFTIGGGVGPDPCRWSNGRSRTLQHC